jgi:ATP-dependent protease HslVU (ClpYQ) peptidase subunit
MTTIAANRKTIAADSQATDENTVYHTDKIFVIGEAIYGAAGLSAATNIFFDWVRNGKPKDGPTLPEDDDVLFGALALTRRGLFIYTGCFAPDRISDRFYALGSGKQVALAAMRMGKSPREAVEMAKTIDPWTGGRVRVLHVKDLGRE